jgi:hypothetical protein
VWQVETDAEHAPLHVTSAPADPDGTQLHTIAMATRGDRLPPLGKDLKSWYIFVFGAGPYFVSK